MWKRIRYVLFLIALCSLATCPAAKRACTAKIRAREAEGLVGAIADKVEAHVSVTGHVPGTAAPLTPQVACCEQGGQCQPDATTWAAPGWKELEFTIDNPYRYAYEYIPEPGGQAATIRAIGNLDCDSALSTYEMHVTVRGTSLDRTWTRQEP